MGDAAGDRKAVMAVLAGDRDAFRALDDRYRGRIRTMALKIAKDGDDADEVAQQALVKAFLNLHRFDLSRPFSAWVFSIALNTCRNVFRDRRRADPLQAMLDAGYDFPGVEDPERDLERAESRRRIQGTLSGLPPRYRELIRLCDHEGRPYDESAAILGCPVGTVKSGLHRARNAFARAYERAA